MKDLKKNKCRICLKVFCCENCREKHEVNFHYVNPACEICLYGKIYSKKVTGDLLNHINDKHLPLSCVFCKKLFEKSTEIEFHSKCMRVTNNRLEMNPMTPIYRQSPLKMQTPYQKSIIMASNAYFAVTNTIVHPTTSTPLQNIRSENDILQKISRDLTPLDNREKENANTSQITPINTDEPKKMEELKRKVTFCDTPNVDYQKNRQGAFTKDLVKYLIIEEDSQCTAPTEKDDRSILIPESDANEKISQNLDIDENSELSQAEQLNNDQKNNIKNDESVWTSAIAESNFTLFKSCNEKTELKESEQSCESTDSDKAQQFSHNSDEFRTPLSNPESSQTTDDNEKLQFRTPNIRRNNSQKTSPEEDNEYIENKSCNFCNYNKSPSEASLTKENERFDEIAHKHNSESDYRTPLCEINCCLIVKKSCSSEHSKNCCTNFDAVDIIKKTIDLKCTPNLNEIEYNKCILDSTNMNEISNELRTRKPIAQSSIIRYCVQRTQKTEICETKFTTSSASEDSNITANKGNSLWSSMTSLVKTVFHGFSSQGVTETKKSNPLKRSCSDDDNLSIEQGPYLKRMKLTDIRCRPTIRNLRPAYRINSFTKPKETADKATQTDESFFY